MRKTTRRGRWEAVVALAAATLVLGGAALASARQAASLPCTAEGGEPVTVRAVGEDFSLDLADGRVVRLAGIDPVRATPDQAGLADEGHGRVARWLVGAPVVLRPLAEVADRWGRLPALVFAAATPAASGAPAAQLLVQQALVDAGLARGRPERASHACWAAIMAAENAARAAGLGLWGDPLYAVRDADDLPALAGMTDGIVVVQGSITNVGQTRSRLYVDLGPIHRSVALRLARRDSFILDQLGVGQGGLVGLTIRVRGLLDDSNGPGIDVSDADQIEVVRPPAPTVAGPADAAP